MASMLQMQNEVMQLTEQLYNAETKAKEADENCKRKNLELWNWQQRAYQLHKDKNKLTKDRDKQMKEIQQNLMMFEASLRSEQRHINQLIHEKNRLIDKQRKEIHMYRALIINKAKSDNLLSRSVFNGRLRSKSELQSVQEADSSTNDSPDDSGSEYTNIDPRDEEQCRFSPVENFDPLAEDVEEKKYELSCLNDNGLNKVNKIILNHRSVTKPKDIKNKRINKERSRSIDICENGAKNATVQYWTHPFI